MQQHIYCDGKLGYQNQVTKGNCDGKLGYKDVTQVMANYPICIFILSISTKYLDASQMSKKLVFHGKGEVEFFIKPTGLFMGGSKLI